jgi:outer membrane protein assembly factor BamB
MDIFHDADRDNIYITNEMSPMLLKYDYTNGTLIDHMRPEGVTYGGTIWLLQASAKTGKLYYVGVSSDYDLLEIDPETLEIERTLDLGTFGGSALKIDEEAGLIYFQHGERDTLYEIDIHSFKVKRTLKGDTYARRLHIDKKRNALYILSFLHGKLIAIDLKSGKRVWTLKVGGKPNGMASHEDILYVNSRAGIVRIDLAAVWKR